MVEFFKKAYANKDLVLSSIHADLYDGKQPTANVGGGRKEQAYLARYTIPSNPSFGSAELSRIDYNVYINSIELARNVYSFPEAAVYKTKDASRITLTEGMQKVDKEATNNTVIFTSHIAGFISIGDSFDGTGKAYGDEVTYIPTQKSIIRQEQPWISPTGIEEYGREIGWGFNSKQDYSVEEYKTGFAFKASELGITNIDANTLCIPLKKGEGKQGYFMKNSAMEWYAEPKPGKNYDKTYIKASASHSVIQYGKRDTLPHTELYGDELTPSNTMFEMVRGAAEVLGEQTKGESGVELLAVGAARFSTTTSLTGGQSGELYTFWKDGATGVKYPALGRINSSSSGSVRGAENRQEVMICKKNIPYPIKHPALPSRRGDELTTDSQDNNDFANTIEIDLNIKSLAKAYRLDVTGGDNYYTLRRALVICFSEQAPTRKTSLFDLIWNHRDTTQSATSPAITLAGSTHVTMPIMGTSTDSDANTNKSFAAVAILNTDDGILICNAARYYTGLLASTTQTTNDFAATDSGTPGVINIDGKSITRFIFNNKETNKRIY